MPDERDLLTEATLPIEERGLQRRYSQVKRFNEFLPPTGTYTLSGPDPASMPNTLEGQYFVLLRIEATDDREADSNLSAVGAGAGVVHSGAVAGFPLPVLRYFVGGQSAKPGSTKETLALLLPAYGALLPPDKPVDFKWAEIEGAAAYRVELQDSKAIHILSAVLLPGVGSYRAPSWLKEKLPDGTLRWRVVALDGNGNQFAETPWNDLGLMPSN